MYLTKRTKQHDFEELCYMHLKIIVLFKSKEAGGFVLLKLFERNNGQHIFAPKYRQKICDIFAGRNPMQHAVYHHKVPQVIFHLHFFAREKFKFLHFEALSYCYENFPGNSR